MAGTGKAHLRDGDALLRVEDLTVRFSTRDGRKVQAVSGISFDVLPGETLGLVGESGCGKSSTGRAIMQLPSPESGTVSFQGRDLTELGPTEMRAVRTDIQMILQDPISSLNPRRRIGDVVAEPLRVWGPRGKDEQRAMVAEMLEAVGMDPVVAVRKRPSQFSGGQCQRIAIARALIKRPALLICDEPVSALDVSVQAQILNLMEDVKRQYGLTLIFIAHDLAVVKNISDRVAVMYLGKLCEVAESDHLYEWPAHPYTNLLLQSSPIPDPQVEIDERLVEDDDIPSTLDPPSGCRFRTRCPRADATCAEVEPQMRAIAPDHFVACHHPVLPGDHPDFSAGDGAVEVPVRVG